MITYSLPTVGKYLFAIALPLLIATASWFVHGLVSPANIALLYILAVIFVAVNTTTRPALVAAVSSFLGFNFTFTEPLGTFLVLHWQDLLMLILFLLAALFIGKLAANLKERLEQLQSREVMSRIEVEFMQKLSAAVSIQEIIEVLRVSLASIAGLHYKLYRCEDGHIDWREKERIEQAKIRQQISEHLASGKAQDKPEVRYENVILFFLGDGKVIHAVLAVYPSAAATEDLARLMAQQAILALTRTRLGADLEAEKLARENELMRTSLLSSLSHDFKTPLTAMIGASSTLLELGDELDPEQRRELLQSILSEAQRLNNFTQKLLDLSHLGEGEFSLSRTTIAIDEIIHAVLKRIRAAFPHTIEFEIDPDLPLVSVHAALIEQALYNVIENACQFTPPDKPVLVRCSTVPGKLVITVDDPGPGIPDEEKTRVFDMFHSVGRGDRRAAGSGLGLAITKGMLGAHGGTVAINDSDRLGGAQVKLSLPVITETTPCIGF